MYCDVTLFITFLKDWLAENYVDFKVPLATQNGGNCISEDLTFKVGRGSASAPPNTSVLSAHLFKSFSFKSYIRARAFQPQLEITLPAPKCTVPLAVLSMK